MTESLSPLLYIIYLAYVLSFIFLAYALLYNVITRRRDLFHRTTVAPDHLSVTDQRRMT